MDVDDAVSDDHEKIHGLGVASSREEHHSGEEDEAEVQAAVEAAASKAPLLPGHLVRVLEVNGSSVQHLQPSQRLMLLAIHAILIETGFLLPNSDKVNFPLLLLHTTVCLGPFLFFLARDVF